MQQHWHIRQRRARIVVHAKASGTRHPRAGSISLDNAGSVLSVHAQLQQIFGNVSTSGLFHGLLSRLFIPARVSIIMSLVLTILFIASPTLIAAAYPSADVTLLQQAALVPTACMLIAFLTNCGLLLASFLSAGAAITTLQRIHAIVLRWHLATAGALARYAAQRTRLLCGAGPDLDAGDGAGGGRDGMYAPPRGDVSPALPALDGAIKELEAVLEAQRGLLVFLAAAAADGAGIRFLGMFRPGAASIGGLLAIAGSAAALALRLAASVYQSQ